VPYRIDLRTAGRDALDRLIDLGALDVEALPGSGVAAVMPDLVPPADVAGALGLDRVHVSPAVGRDADSVWVLQPRPIHVGASTLVITDSAAFGTGLHPTTALCLDALQRLVAAVPPDRVLDVGTGSGVLALAALLLGVPHALGIDTDPDALRSARENARLNGLEGRLEVAHGGPDMIAGAWPLVLANVLAAPLIEMAPALVRRIGHHGRLVLSGIPESVEPDVTQTYIRLGMHRQDVRLRGGWVAITLRASW
jgi:ribosomal protein L11 methyltransferase